MRSGLVALAGRPNVGKSTLVNALAGGKVAIVSDKPQTTRRRILGAVHGDGWQLVLVDLPGFQRPRDLRRLLKAALRAYRFRARLRPLPDHETPLPPVPVELDVTVTEPPF